MDGLALFCNLCADGPVTLRRLRAAGVRDLEQLATTEPDTLASWLHASLPQARTFAAEASRLAQRLGEPARGVRVEVAARVSSAPLAAPDEREERLAPGLLPGLDATICARLASVGVRTRRALAEGAGLALARRTGVPYSALLALARAARQPGVPTAAPAKEGPRSQELRVHELVPQVRSVPTMRPAPTTSSAPEAPLGDPFALPLLEPESAGPFG